MQTINNNNNNTKRKSEEPTLFASSLATFSFSVQFCLDVNCATLATLANIKRSFQTRSLAFRFRRVSLFNLCLALLAVFGFNA